MRKTKRIVSLILTVIMSASLFSNWPMPAFAADSISITTGNTAVVNLKETTIITANNSDTYQWQIYAEEFDMWVNIQNETDAQLGLTYAMIANMLGTDGTAKVRCKSASGVTEEVAVSVDYTEDIFEESSQQVTEPVVTPTPEATEEPVVEATPAPEATEESVVEETPAPVLETIPEDATFALERNVATVADETDALGIPFCNCNSTDLDLTTHGDDCVRKSYVRKTYIVENSAAEIYADWNQMDEYTQNAVRMFLSWDIQTKLNELNTLIQQGASQIENVTVTINYYLKGNIYGMPWTAQIAKGSDLSQANIKNFEIIGYAPTLQAPVDGVTFTEEAISLNLTNVQSNITINVVYQPAEVNYTVNHYVQNVGDDFYTLVETETQQGYTDAIVDAAEKTADDGEPWSGLTALVYNHPEIAADGSTSIDIYYNRNYYLMYFNLDGGYGVEPIYGRYGAPVTGVGTPTKAGWTFSSWSPNLPTTIPVGGGTYDAIWGNAQRVNYTVVYWRENADDSNYSYWGSDIKQATAGSLVSGADDVPTSVSNATVDGQTINEKQFFTFNSAMTDVNVEVEGDGTTVVNVYYYRNYYTILFRGYGKCALTPHTHSDACLTDNLLICGGSTHEHTDECNGTLVCTIAEHTHTDECYTCTAHTHSSLCCDLTEHTAHTEDCYTCIEHTAHTVECYTITSRNGNNTATISSSGTTIKNNDIEDRYNNGIVRDEDNLYYLQIGNLYYRLSGLNNSQYDNANVVIKDELHTHGDGNCTYRDELHTHGDGNCTCPVTAHTHGDGNCTYKDTEHTHTDACYKYECGEETHIHTEACYRDCPLPEHTHSNNNNCTTNRTNNVIHVVTAKYNRDISAVWPTYDLLAEKGYAYKDNNGNVENNNNQMFRGWDVDGVSSEAVSKRLNMTWDLCDTSDGEKDAEAQYDAPHTYRLYYMFESLDQTSPENGNERREYDGVYYDSDPAYYQELQYINDTTFGQKPVAGMNPEGVEKETTGSSYQGNYIIYNFLYYSRNRYDLTYQNIDTTPKIEEDIIYGAALGTYQDTENKYLKDYVPPYPAQYQAGLYTFEGWYTTPECYDGTEFNWANETMPEGDLTVYAKWSPVIRHVSFYYTKDALEAGEAPLEGKIYEVANGTILVEMPDQPTRPPYNFVGWFYTADDGTEKAFDFNNMPITKDLKVYAKWDARVLVQYFIYYKTMDGEENVGEVEVIIADYTDGEGVTGTSMTFFAKTGDELYSGYQTGYYPNVESHSLTFDVEDVSKNTFTFWYTKQDAVPYKVEYILLDEAGNEVGPAFYVDDEDNIVNASEYQEGYEVYVKNVENNYSTVVTEVFRIAPGYMPDAYSKRLIVTTTGENIIRFYYTPNTTQAYYKISHWVETDNGQYIELTDYTTQNIGDINSTIDVTGRQLSLPGYKYIRTMWTHGTSTEVGTSATLTVEGLEFRFYYDRLSYPYITYYVEQGTGKTLAPFKYDDDALYEYGTRVYENAITIPGYEPLQAAQSHVMTHEIISEGAYPVANVITFYYAEKDVTINYVPVTADMGSVSVSSETQKAISGTMSGSVPTANEDYTFIGWYKDAACTIPVTDKDGTVVEGTNQFIPAKHTQAVAGTDVSYDVYLPATYYAKFRETKLPITYVAVTDTQNAVNFGEVKLNSDGTSAITVSEEVNKVTGTAGGATAVETSHYYHFDGWYADPECTQLITTYANFVPSEVKEATYYAKFVEDEVVISYWALSVRSKMATDIGTVNGDTIYDEVANIVSGPVNGATAVSGSDYQFLGWYDGRNIKTAELISTDVKFVPSKVAGKDQTYIYEKSGYYAIFEEIIDLNYIAVDENFNQLADTTIGSVALNPDGSGVVQTSESLGEYTGTAVGANAAATIGSGYVFAGWFVQASDGSYSKISDNAAYTPSKNGDYYEDGTYYAKFVPSYIEVQKAVTVTGGIQTVADISATYTKDAPALFELYNGETKVATAQSYYNGTEFTTDKFVDDAGKVFIPKQGVEYTIKETSAHYVDGYFLTNADVAVTVQTGEYTAKADYTNTYIAPAVTITKDVKSTNVNGDFVDEAEINRLINKYGTNGKYKAVFVLTDESYGDAPAGNLTVELETYSETVTANRTGSVTFTDKYLEYIKDKEEVALTVRENTSAGNTTIFGTEMPGIDFASDSSNVDIDASDNTFATITLSAATPDADLECTNTYPPERYITVHKQLVLDSLTDEQKAEVIASYKNKNVTFELKDPAGTVVATAETTIKEDGTFDIVTFITKGDSMGNAFEPTVGVQYTVVETSVHRLAGYVWAHESKTVSITDENLVGNVQYPNTYTETDIGIDLDKSLIFRYDPDVAEDGTVTEKPFTREEIRESFDLINENTESSTDAEDGIANKYVAVFGLYELNSTADYDKLENATLLAKATVEFSYQDFVKSAYDYTHHVVKSIDENSFVIGDGSPLEDDTSGLTDGELILKYIKEKGEAETQTILAIKETDETTCIGGQRLTINYDTKELIMVLGGVGTENQDYYTKATVDNIFPPSNFSTSLKIVKEAYGDLQIPHGEQFIFKLKYRKQGEDIEKLVYIEWDAENTDNNFVMINDLPLETVVAVETTWGWRYDAVDQNGNSVSVLSDIMSIDSSQNVITFSNKEENDKWLDSSDIKMNDYSRDGNQTTTNPDVDNVS